MATTSEMLKAIHKADPSTLNKRYSDAQLLAAYNKLSKKPVATTATTPAQSSTTSSPATTATTATTPVTPIDPQRVQTRIDYLKDVRPNDPQIAELQDKLASNQTMSDVVGSSVTTPATTTSTAVEPETGAASQGDPTRIQTRIDFLKRTRPNDPEIATLQQRLSAITNPPGGGGGGGGGGTVVDTPGTVDTPGGVTVPSGSVEITPEMVDRFNQTVTMGKQFGNSLIDDLGLRGEFLGRVSEGPSDSYYADLNNLRTLANTANAPTALDTEALGYARNALGGLDTVENQALRSAAVQDVDRQFGQARQQLLRYQGGLGSAMQRSAQMSDLGAKRVDAQRSLARDLLIQNIQEKKDARNAFAELTGQVGSRTDSRTQNLNALLQTGLLGADQLKQAGEQFNVGSQSAETSARTSALTGGIGAVGSALGGYKAEDFQNLALKEALSAKDKEIEATKTLAQKALESQEKIANMLKGQI